VILHFVAHRSHGLIEDGLYEGHAPTASGAGFCARLDVADALAGSVFNRFNHIAFSDVVT
jgi:hypothetical protein